MLSDEGWSIKVCMFVGAESNPSCNLTQTSPPKSAGFSLDAHREVFLKTLAFFVTVASKRCHAAEPRFWDEHEDHDEHESIIDELSPPFDIRARLYPVCDGRIQLHIGSHGKPYTKCEHWRKGHKGHLIITKLDEYDIKYLTALLENDTCYTRMVELDAKAAGYGPLHSCGYVAARREQKRLCPHWHRTDDGRLERGILEPQKVCQTRFEIYVPNDLPSCPQIIIVSRSPHSHIDPRPTKTPLTIIEIFNSFLRGLNWRLADATPRRLSLDSAFMAALRNRLLWTGLQDPLLSALHPSLGNMDHTARLIDLMRAEYFPNGSGLKGAKELCQQHKLLPPSEQYVRAVETVTLPGLDPFTIIICMLPSMSGFLMTTKRPTIDTSFKRADGFEEFEIEAWFPDDMRSIVCARVFVTSGSAPAHLAMFKLVFKIAEDDTGVAVKFKHIHGSGYEVMVADAHKGQALEFGPQVQVRMRRGIHKLGNHITDEVRTAMHSLSSSSPVPDLEEIKNLIRHGGSKSAAWMNDKEVGSPFVIPAIYQPASKIPLEVWQAAPSTSNGNEQAHRNVNRDGTGLTLLAAIMRGLQYDVRAVRSVGLMGEAGIHQRDQQPTYFRRAGRSVLRSVRVQKRKLASIDEELRETHRQLDVINEAIVVASSLRTPGRPKGGSRATKTAAAALLTLQKLDVRRRDLEFEAKGLQDRSSGGITARDFPSLLPSAELLMSSAEISSVWLPTHEDEGSLPPSWTYSWVPDVLDHSSTPNPHSLASQPPSSTSTTRGGLLTVDSKAGLNDMVWSGYYN
ncbi:hypothetical protein K439DRAFT_1621146 [Ramaria rubella]|nr:hypothetical protein K439DRAFT_1621146 [Ramaria rubella]